MGFWHSISGLFGSRSKASTTHSRREPPRGFAPWRRLLGGITLSDTSFVKLYKSTAFAAIQIRANAVARTEFQFHRRISETEVEPLSADHWLPMLWADPTGLPHITMRMILQWIEQYHCGAGESGVIVTLGPDPLTGMQVPVEMYAIPREVMTPILGPERFIDEWQIVGANGEIERYPAEQVCYFMTPQPAEDIVTMYTDGKALIEAAIDDIQAEASVKEAIRQSLTDALFPPYFMRTKSKTSKLQRDQFRQQIRERGKRADRSVPLGFLEDGWEPVPIEQFKTAKEGQQLAPSYKQSICNVLGIPPGLLDNVQLNGRTTIEALLYWLQINTTEPRAEDIAEIFTRFFRQWEADIEITIVPVNRREAIEERADDTFLLDFGLATPNMIAERRGLPKIPSDQGGDTYFIRGVPVEQVMSGKAVQTAQGTSEKDDSIPDMGKDKFLQRASESGSDPFYRDDRAMLTYWRSYAKPMRHTAARLKTQIAGAFDELETKVLASIREDRIYREGDTVGGIVFDAEAFTTALEAATTDTLRDHIRTAVGQAGREVVDNWDDIVSDFDEAIEQTLTASVGKVTETTDDVRAQLLKVISRNRDKPLDERIAAIRAKFEQFKEGKAQAIARTSSTFATNAAQSAVWDQLDIESAWLDERGRGTGHRHAHMRGQRKDENGLYHNSRTGASGPHPGALSSAKDVVNCMCIQRARPKEE